MLLIDCFRTMLDEVTPHMSADDIGLPMLCGVLVEATEAGLLLIATDMNTRAVTRHPQPSPHPWTAFLTRGDVKAYQALARAARTRAARLTPDGQRLILGVGEHTLALSNHDEHLEKFPRWRPMLSSAVQATPNLTDPVLLDSRLNAPLVIARGEHFIGVHKPLRHLAAPERHPMHRARDAWRGALAGPTPPALPAPPTAPTRQIAA